VTLGTLGRAPGAAETERAEIAPDRAEVRATATSAPVREDPADEPARSAGADGADGADGAAPLWTIDGEASSLTFTFEFSGDPVTGRFAEWSADVRFDPDNLDGSSIAVRIPTPSAKLDSDDVTKAQLSGEDGFDDDEYGTATFTADTIRKADGGGYVAEGTLTIRGTSVPQTLAFTVDIEGDEAIARGSVTVDRLDYDIGTENDPGADWVSREVTIDVAVEATRAGAAEARPRDGEAAAAASGPQDGGPAQWTLLPEESDVDFSFGFQRDEVTGTIEAFSTDIRFDPQDLDGSSIAARLDLSSATIEGNAVSSTQLKGSDGLAVDDSRFARFEANTIRRAGEDTYEAQGTLRLRGESVPVTLPFNLVIDEGRAVAEGSLTLDRLAFGVGKENDPEGSMIDPRVDVSVKIVAANAEAPPDVGR